MKIAVVYYTGTGGTRIVATKLHEAFSAFSDDCGIHRIHISNVFSITGCQHAAIVYPVHAGRSPRAVEAWAKEMGCQKIRIRTNVKRIETRKYYQNLRIILNWKWQKLVMKP